ncbi:hypothetical protein QZJ86_15715 [Methylomonas montana]|uniref:hypothetical protein n=1 Tax=Methylomonas montana TaxID=3058963 RepID=UPI00265AFA72|nr:hypothetical protein [Methylomonas montana]WKJ89457.1 hypothetical protein QZJ86_15715 [Methylomonas montana]
MALAAETNFFGTPLVLVNGDSHYFRLDKPLPSEVKVTKFPIIVPWEASERRLQNFIA